MPTTAFIQLARRGDIVNILPIAREKVLQGRDVSIYVHPDFAEILEPVSYVQPILWDGLHRDVWRAYDDAVARGFDEVLDTQVDGQFRPPPVNTDSFLTESWSRAGYLDRFHELPLVFDRRDFEGESESIRQVIGGRDARPILAYALHGHSSPFHRFAEFERWLRREFSEYRVIDIGKPSLRKVHHLIGLIEQASVMITADTLHLHLSYATRTPTIALQADAAPGGNVNRTTWYHSEPRAHWIGRMRYGEALSPAGQRTIGDLIHGQDFGPCRCLRQTEAMRHERIAHIVDWFMPEAGSERRRLLAARKTWEHLVRQDGHWDLIFHETSRHARRTSADLGDGRSLPFVRDLLDIAAERAGDSGIVCLSNSDSCIVPEAAAAIRLKLMTVPCAFGRRVDVHATMPPMSRTNLAGRMTHPGADLFAMRSAWWRDHRDGFPDLLYACEGWDFVLRQLMLRDHPEAEILPPLVYHEAHRPYWLDHHADAGQRHNRRLCIDWANGNGLARAIHGDGSPFLFKADGAF